MIPNKLSECPYYLISRVNLVVMAALKKGFAAAGIKEVKPAYLCVLMSLWQEDGLKVIALGKKAGLEPSTMTGLLDRMERDELVVRTTDPNDRRVLRINLTRSGRQVRDPVLKVVDKVLTDIFAGIKADDISQTKTLLRHVLANAHEKSM
ncbi:MAG: MarR family transcriptional regulator [Desulfobacterales bacterium]|jgi:DNA-binding MarR family transcriptional regulator